MTQYFVYKLIKHLTRLIYWSKQATNIGRIMKTNIIFLCVFLLQLAFRISECNNDQLEAEGYFVVDNKALQMYLREEDNNLQGAKDALEREVELWIDDVNAYYKTLEQYGMSLRMSIVDIHILDFDLNSNNEITPPDVINEKTTLDNFGEFLKGKNPSGQPKKSESEYDFALFLTGYNINDPVNGYAKQSTICIIGESYGIAEWNGLINHAPLFAHEIGHILGCEHDPRGSVTVMTPHSKPTTNLDKYKFSEKSASDIKAYLNILKQRGIDNCLELPSRPGSRLPAVKPELYTGRAQDPTTICKRAAGNSSSPCTHPTFWKNEDGSHKSSIVGDDICAMMFCHKLNSEMCLDVRPMEGMKCAKGKSCRKGRCVNDPRPTYQNVKSECVFGDDQEPRQGLTCEDIIQTDLERAQLCQRSFGSQCCETCPKYQTGDPDCPYGDVNQILYDTGEAVSCAEALKQSGAKHVCDNMKTPCCATCKKLRKEKGTGPDCKYGDDDFVTVNNKQMTCAAIIKEWGHKFTCVEDDYLKTRCCASCAKTKGKCMDVSYINFDNEDLSCRETITTLGAYRVCVESDSLKKECCKSCKDVEQKRGAGGDCKYGDDEFLNFNNERTTCGAMLKQWGTQMTCFDNDYLKKRCCATCQSSEGQCSDTSSINFNNEWTTCDAMVKEWGYQVACVDNDYLKSHCCGSCSQYKGKCFDINAISVDNVGLSCRDTITKLGAYRVCQDDADMSIRCCKSCQDVKQLRGTGPSCEYGDEEQLLVNVGGAGDKLYSCPELASAVGGKENMCGQFSRWCCKTCGSDGDNTAQSSTDCADASEIEIDGEKLNCKETLRLFGAHHSCVADDTIKSKCCQSCKKRKKQSGAGKGCEYGEDKEIRMVVEGGTFTWVTCSEIVGVFGKAMTCSAFGQRCCVTCNA